VNNIGSVPTPGTEQIIQMTYSYNENGSINNIDMTGHVPTGVVHERRLLRIVSNVR
jgi:hypothetical protein